MADEADFILAANGKKFDKLVMDAFLNRYFVEPVVTTKYEWVDLYEFPFPETCKYRNLLYLAAYYGFINPFPHRALSDAMTMMKIASNFDMQEILNRRATPPITLVAKVSYNNRAQASERGFMWQKARKAWIRVIHESDLETLTPILETYPFEVDFIEGDVS
jgi:DNA polymerase-3 subunit epsilon